MSTPITAIDEKRAALQWFGDAVNDHTPTPNGKGWYRHYQNGSIYWSPETGAQEIYGAIRDKWASLGWENSFLGYPTTGELPLPNTDGRFSNFERGQIAWSPAHGAAVSATSFAPHTGGGIRPLGLPPGGEPEVRRRVVVAAHMDLTDHETFGSDEHGTGDKSGEVLVTNFHPQELVRMETKAGGEMRVELKVDVQAILGGDVRVTGKALLFEGTSEETGDLDGDEDINFIAARDNFTPKKITIRNEDEGDDFAEITMNVSNFAA